MVSACAIELDNHKKNIYEILCFDCFEHVAIFKSVKLFFIIIILKKCSKHVICCNIFYKSMTIGIYVYIICCVIRKVDNSFLGNVVFVCL